MSGQRAKGIGTDCVGFVVSVVTELSGQTFKKPPLSNAFKVRSSSMKAFRQYLKAFPADVIEGEDIEPGDVVLAGYADQPMKHAYIAGNKSLWHCGTSCVTRTGFDLSGMFVSKILRCKNKGGW
jgi:hypothetical protein